MNDKMALNLIAEIMGWGDDEDGVATREYAWLRLMSSIKYDGYADFRAGVRFLESLAAWLQQFSPPDRQAAYAFVKLRMVYISSPELLRLIEAFVPEVVTPNLRAVVACELGCAPYEVWSTGRGALEFKKRLRRTLFVGMSDGSRIDMLRRANAARLSPEQVVPVMNVDDEKWRDIADNLEKEQGPGAKFDSVYLVDDFTASGTTFIRRVGSAWKGKLKKFNAIVCEAKRDLGNAFPLADGFALHVHHYLSSHQARSALLERMTFAQNEWAERSYGTWTVTEGLCLPSSLKLSGTDDHEMLAIGGAYYDHSLFKRLEKHCREAGQTDMKLGYGECALPIVLEHNTPNNSIPLLWAETDGSFGPRVEPLFRRRDRHG